MTTWKQINPGHAIFGGCSMLGEHEVLACGDQAGRLSLLLCPEDCPEWWTISEVSDWARFIGKTVAEARVGDMDANELVFRRPERKLYLIVFDPPDAPERRNAVLVYVNPADPMREACAKAREYFPDAKRGELHVGPAGETFNRLLW